MTVSTAGDLLSGWIDLETTPFTTIGSRLLVSASPEGLTVYEAAYERPLTDSVAVGALVVTGPDGAPATVVGLTTEALVLSNGTRMSVTADGRVVLADLPASSRVSTSRESIDVPPGCGVEFLPGPAWPRDPRLHGRPAPAAALARDCDQVAERTQEWMSRCPRAAAPWRTTVERCWWTLGVNTIDLRTSHGPTPAVVPSKLGYLGAWQWDSYFIAIGLRWGDPELAAQQLRLAVRDQLPDGQLPDVVFDGGVLASSADLPPADLARLRELASPCLNGRDVPLTKPPLLALAVDKVAACGQQDLIGELEGAVRANLNWWRRASSRGGVPYYLHPYSSGLDDSPIFDDDALVSSPDLLSYLVVCERTAARWARRAGRGAQERSAEDEAARLTALLAARWDDQRGLFPALGQCGRPLRARTIVSLMPLLVEDLPSPMRQRMVDDLQDARRFATHYRIPTVATSDEDYAPSTMWRGPVWVNTAWLVCEGLRRAGGQGSRGMPGGDHHDALARRIEDEVVSLVAASGPWEYFHPDTGRPCPGATVLFSWTAALTIDIAMRRTVHGDQRSL